MNAFNRSCWGFIWKKLTCVELYVSLSTVIKMPNVELFETDLEAVEMVREVSGALPRKKIM